MGHKKGFKIPLTTDPLRAEATFELSSMTIVIPTQVRLSVVEVERVPGSWSPHIPERAPMFRLWCDAMFGTRHHYDIQGVRLVSIPFGETVLVRLRKNRRQTVLLHAGKAHVSRQLTRSSGWTGCDRHVNIETYPEHLVRDGVPTCPVCLGDEPEEWVSVVVLPYVHPSDKHKEDVKARKAARKKQSRPSFYVRLKTTQPLKRLPKPPPAPLPEAEEPEPDSMDPRRAKVEARGRQEAYYRASLRASRER